MSKLTWDASGARFYETGIDHVVLFIKNGENYGKPIAWNGVSSVSESPSGADENAIYADNIKYLSLYGAEEFGATIEAYGFPKEFMQCDGFGHPTDTVNSTATAYYGFMIGQQPRKQFGLYYRTRVGNDSGATKYKHHFIWNCMAGVSQRSYETINDSPEPISFSWEITTIPMNEMVNGTSVTTASLTIDETSANASQMTKINALIDYVTDNADGHTMPDLQDIYDYLD